MNLPFHWPSLARAYLGRDYLIWIENSSESLKKLGSHEFHRARTSHFLPLASEGTRNGKIIEIPIRVRIALINGRYSTYFHWYR